MAMPCLGPAGSCVLHAASSSLSSVAPSSAEGGGAAGNGGASPIRELVDAFDTAMAEPGGDAPAHEGAASANPAQPGFDAAEPASHAASRGADAVDAGSAVMSPTELLKIQYTVSMLSSDAGGSAEFSKHISEDVEALLKQKD